MGKIRLLVVDDHAIMRDGIRALLTLHDDIEIVGEATEGKEAIQKVQGLLVDIVIMDITLSGMDGLEATRHIKKKNPNVKVLVVTQYDNREYILSALKAGADGYLPKLALSSELISAIRNISSGDSFLHHSAADALVKGYQQKDLIESYEELAANEQEILRLSAEGYTNREIAETLKISVNAVVSSRAQIMKKLNLRNHTELIKYAIHKKLVG